VLQYGQENDASVDPLEHTGVKMSTIHWTTLSEVQSQPVQWLWEGRIPFGKVTLLDGEPGSGKSLLAMDLAARVSRGAAMPLARTKPSGPANVVLYNDDDNLDDTVRPRFEAAGADLSRIRCVDGRMCAADIQELRPSLIILDPLAVYLCTDCDLPPRSMLKDITQLARESGAAVLAVYSLPKNDGWGTDIYDVARSVLHISTIGHGRSRVSLTKSNLRAINDVPPLVYHVEETESAVKLTGWADSV
jgi:DNA repair protein RadA/Sms